MDEIEGENQKIKSVFFVIKLCVCVFFASFMCINCSLLRCENHPLPFVFEYACMFF